MKRFVDLIAECLPHIKELYPWDVDKFRQEQPEVLLIDTREPYEFQAARIEGSMNVPRGILEQSCEWDFEETLPELVQARDKPIVVICRSGNRSVLAAYTMQQMGYENVKSLKTGLKGWTDYEQPLVDNNNHEIDIDDADAYFTSKVKPEQMRPK